MFNTSQFHLLAGTALSVLATGVAAQTPTANAAKAPVAAVTGTTPAQDPAASADAAPIAATTDKAAPASADGDTKGIVVTGSRIVRAGFQAPTPVTVVRTEELVRNAPTNIPDALNQLPIFQNSISQNTGDSTQSNRVRSGNYLNLRALGPNRVLVLQDGHRVPPTSSNGGTDTNLIPQILVERVDVVTGGASAAYGSDAVSGVVNFILDKKFEGAKFQMQRGVSSRGDNGSYKVGGAYGISLLDNRLHLIASGERYHSDGIEYRADRPRGGDFITYGGAGTAASPFRFYDNVHYSTVSEGGYINTGPLAGRQFLPGGLTGPFNPGTSIGRAGLAQNGEGGDAGPDYTTLIPSLTTNQIYGRASYEFSDNLSFYIDGSYNEAINKDNNLNFLRIGQMTIFRDNAFLQPAVLSALGNAQSFTMSREFREYGGMPSQQRSTAFNLSTGLEGKIHGWKWSLGYVHGDTKFRNVTTEPYLPNFYASLDAVRNSAGNIVCRVAVTNPGLMDNCVPINPFGAGAPSQAAIDYTLGQSIWGTRNKMDLGSLDLSGTLFNTWAGPVSLAVGGEYRHQSLVQTSNSDPTVPVPTTGIRGFFGATPFYATNVGAARGSYTIKEAYIEVTVPLAKDSVIGKSLELNGAGRYTDYSTSGSVKTWKLGATYEPVDGVRFRGTVSRDIRAPSLYELFAGQTINVVPVNDTLTNQLAIVPTVSGGNPDLKPEIAKTYTAGVVVQPHFVPGLSASFDYYNIKIDGAIATPYNAQTAVNICNASGGTDPVCGQITRPFGYDNTTAANIPTAISLINQNVSKLQTSGVDFEIGYRRQVAGGTASVRVLGTRLISYKRTQLPGQPAIEYAGNGDLPGFNSVVPLPKWRGNLELAYTRGGLSLSMQERMIGSYKKSLIQVYDDNHMPAIFYTDMTASYSLPAWKGKAELFLTVNNLFDRDPPLWPVSGTPGSQLPTQRTLYDVIGRYMTIGVRAKF